MICLYSFFSILLIGDNLDKTVDVFILTFNQEISEEYDSELYKPLVCGRGITENKPGYFYDDEADNISNLNKYYSELTGEYWAWKNTDQDIIGFCHYRRWYVRNLRWDKITKSDIINDLNEYDIILPKPMKFIKPLYEFHKSLNVERPDYDVLFEDYVLVEDILKRFFPKYAKTYNDVMNDRYLWLNNMFICNRELANDYFDWLFKVFDKISEEIDFDKYQSRDTRIFGFMAERLLTTYVIANNLNVKEYNVFLTMRKFPIAHVLICKYPILTKFEKYFEDFMKKLPFH